MADAPMLIAVAPNGARKTRRDHPALPITPLELARTAAACAEAGAGMLHLHVRDNSGGHTLEADFYKPAIREVEAAVGDTMLLQVTSEAAGVYNSHRQMELMKGLAPHCLSCGLREFVTNENDFEAAAAFFTAMKASGVLIQYILYSPDDVRWYQKLRDAGVLPGHRHFLLFVLGRYTSEHVCPPSLSLDVYVNTLRQESNWMACAFGTLEHEVIRRAAKLGGHGRVGFENNLYLPSGRRAPDNSALVESAVHGALQAGRTPAGKAFAEGLF